MADAAGAKKRSAPGNGDKRADKRKKEAERRAVEAESARQGSSSDKLDLPGKYHLVLQNIRDDTPDCNVKISRVYTSQYLTIGASRLSVTGNKGYRLARGSHAVPGYGSWYYEIVVELNQGHVRVGWASGQADKDLPCGCEPFSYSYRDTEGTKFTDRRGSEYGNPYTTGDVIGCHISLPEKPDTLAAAERTDQPTPYNGLSADGKPLQIVYWGQHAYYVVPDQEKMEKQAGSEVRFTKNGVDQGLAFSGLWKAHYYPAVSLFKNARVTFNFGPDFKYPPPPPMAKSRPISDLAELLRPREEPPAAESPAGDTPKPLHDAGVEAGAGGAAEAQSPSVASAAGVESISPHGGSAHSGGAAPMRPQLPSPAADVAQSAPAPGANAAKPTPMSTAGAEGVPASTAPGAGGAAGAVAAPSGQRPAQPEQSVPGSEATLQTTAADLPATTPGTACPADMASQATAPAPAPAVVPAAM